MAMVLQLKVVAVAKYALVPLSNLDCLSIVIIAQRFTNLTTCTAAQDDQPFVELLEEVMINPRLIVHPL